MEKAVLIISTMDTKWEQALYLKRKLGELGIVPFVMDISMLRVADFSVEITSEQVASAGGSNFLDIQSSKDRAKNTDTIIKGALRLAEELYHKGKIQGILGIGGSTGSLIATEVMRSSPFGIPKLMISSTASLPGLSTRYIGSGDIILFHSVIEITGMSDILKNVLDRASYAMAGMIQGHVTSPKNDKVRSIAMTMMGTCERCANWVREALEKAGYQVIGFSAAGIGDRAMEDMILQGYFQGVIDLAPGGVGEHLMGCMRDAGPRRLESAGKVGIPQLVSTCCVNHMSPAKSRYKPEYNHRRKYVVDKFRTLLRLSPDELRAVAAAFAEKLNKSKGPVAIIIALKGWSSADSPGGPTYDPDEDRLFSLELREKLNSRIEIIEVDANMEERIFAEAAGKAALELLK